MNRVSGTLAAAIAGLALAGGAAMAQGSQNRPANVHGTGAASAPPPLLAPASQPDPMLNNGCWVQLMDNVDKPKGREYLTIVGGKYMPALETASGKNWAGRADGISVGPNATAKVYAGHAYTGLSVVLEPNQIVQDLRADLGPVDSIDSMQIECQNS